jgi:hypothetical protein
MSRTTMRPPTDLLVMRENVREAASFASGMMPGRVRGAPSAPLQTHRVVSWEELQGRAPGAVTVPLRMEWFDNRIRTIPIVVIDLHDLTEEIRLDGHTIGFITRAGRIFVARAGARLDRAEECAQSLIWDKVATILVALSGRLAEPEEHDPRLWAGSGGPQW